jgi:hypothetical protein
LLEALPAIRKDFLSVPPPERKGFLYGASTLLLRNVTTVGAPYLPRFVVRRKPNAMSASALRHARSAIALLPIAV